MDFIFGKLSTTIADINIKYVILMAFCQILLSRYHIPENMLFKLVWYSYARKIFIFLPSSF